VTWVNAKTAAMGETPAAKVPVSVIVPVKNEQENLPACLEHLAWAHEVFVVDSGSTDRTAAIAAQYGARLVQFTWDGQFPKKKNWSLRNLPFQNDWILIVDADEHITRESAREIAAVMANPGDKVGFYINRKFIFMGAWLKHCGYYPSWNLRLIKQGHGEYEKISHTGDTKSGDNEVHEHVLCDGPVGWLKEDMIHYAFPTIEVFIEKHNRYSNWEAMVQLEQLGSGLPANPFGHALERRRFLKRLASHLPCRPFLRFFYSYVLRLGFLDGRRGLIFCRLLATYEFLSVAKYQELKIKRAIRQQQSSVPSATAAKPNP
jgi:glycosyltransferase involved in cell wall biosynthesis